jgi:transcriptional regulator with XRE-family HTH domain
VEGLADRLNQIMEQRGIIASEIADGAGISRPVMSRYLSKRSGISAENLIKLSQHLNVSPDWLLNGSDAPESIKMSKSVSVDKNTIIDVQKKYIANLEKQVKGWEDWKARGDRHAKGKAKADQAISKNKQKVGFLKRRKPKN